MLLTDHDMADGLTKEAFQQGNDKYIIKERKKDISHGKATVGSSLKEQILFEESNDHKRKRDLEDRNINRWSFLVYMLLVGYIISVKCSMNICLLCKQPFLSVVFFLKGFQFIFLCKHF